ncbi:MAG: DUF4129 domain-containing protein [Verrucomicrobiota bacterium]
MKLEDITAEIRPRSNLEAADLGWALGRVHFWKMFGAWALTVWPIWALIIGLLWHKPVLALLIIWLLKPFCERIPLFILSRELFGASPTLGQILKATPRCFFGSWFRIFFVSHFSPFRSLTMPIADLENLSGSAYFRRATVISNHSGGTAWWTQVACTMFIHIIWFSIYTLVMFLMPSQYQPEVGHQWQEMWLRIDEFFRGILLGEIRIFSPSVIWLCIGGYLVALTVILPFYAASGFALYLNARSHIEGWDIELTLRRMSNRIQGIAAPAAAIAAVLLILSPGSQQLQAQESSPEGAIESVLEHPDFEVHTRHILVQEPKESRANNSKSSGPAPSWGGGLGGSNIFTGASSGMSALFWIVTLGGLGLIILCIVYLIVKKVSDREPEKAKARTVMGMNVTKESLPPDIISAARSLWKDGKIQESIGLLYRAAISDLIDREVPIEESDTEVECVWRARRAKLGEEKISNYFRKLTETWVRTAYGKENPGESEMNDLCETWPFALR